MYISYCLHFVCSFLMYVERVGFYFLLFSERMWDLTRSYLENENKSTNVSFF